MSMVVYTDPICVSFDAEAAKGAEADIKPMFERRLAELGYPMAGAVTELRYTAPPESPYDDPRHADHGHLWMRAVLR